MLHTELPIYRTGLELMKLALQVQRQIPRDFKRSLGDKIMSHCTALLSLMALANAARGQQRAHYLRELLEVQHAATVLLRVAHEMQFVSHELWGSSVQLLQGIGSQGGGWLKKTNEKAPAA